jgi:hypothetical protein
MSRQRTREYGRRTVRGFNNGSRADPNYTSPVPYAAPRASQAGHDPIAALAQAFAEQAPLEAARALAAGLMAQVRHGRVAALCAAVDALSTSDPEFGAAVVNRLRGTTPPAAAAGGA